MPINGIPNRVEVYGGVGDLLMMLPLVEQMIPCDIYANKFYRNRGVETLVTTLLPFVRCRFHHKWRRDYVGYDMTVNSVLDRAALYGVEPRRVLSTEAISRLKPMEGMGDFILVHPYASTSDRCWRRWEGMRSEYGGSRMVATGFEEGLPGNFEHSFLDFYRTAKMMRAARGVVAVNSSMMNMANILGVRCVSIHPTVDLMMRWSCNGVSLLNPTVKELEGHIWSYLLGS